MRAVIKLNVRWKITKHWTDHFDHVAARQAANPKGCSTPFLTYVNIKLDPRNIYFQERNRFVNKKE